MGPSVKNRILLIPQTHVVDVQVRYTTGNSWSAAALGYPDTDYEVELTVRGSAAADLVGQLGEQPSVYAADLPQQEDSEVRKQLERVQEDKDDLVAAYTEARAEVSSLMEEVQDLQGELDILRKKLEDRSVIDLSINNALNTKAIHNPMYPSVIRSSGPITSGGLI